MPRLYRGQRNKGHYSRHRILAFVLALLFVVLMLALYYSLMG